MLIKKHRYNIQWRIKRVLDAGIPVWSPELSAQIIEKWLKKASYLIHKREKTFTVTINRRIRNHSKPELTLRLLKCHKWQTDVLFLKPMVSFVYTRLYDDLLLC